MRHSIIITAVLVSHLLFREPSSSSAAGEPISRYAEISKNVGYTDVDLVDDFFEHVERSSLKNFALRIVILVGSSAGNLYKAKSLIENSPSVVYTNLERCPTYGAWFDSESLVIVFLDEITEETLSKNDGILSCNSCSILYITEGEINQKGSISSTFYKAMKRSVPRVKFAQFDKNSVKLYGYHIAENCTMEIRFERVWTPFDKGLNFFDGWFRHVNDFKGCPVTVSTCSFAPRMMIEKRDDGSEAVTGGSEGHLLLTLAKNLNFTLVVTCPDSLDQMKYSRRTAVINDVRSGKADLAINGLRRTLGLANLYTSMEYDKECTVWTVPRQTTWKNNIPWLVFTWNVWILIGLAFAAVYLFGYVYQKINLSRNGIENDIEFSAMFLDILALNLGNSVVHVPLLRQGRIILMSGLWYALIVTTAFKTSLASILTTDKGSPVITDPEGIIEANFRVGGSTYNLDMLKDQTNDSDTASKLVDRFVVINNYTEAMSRFDLDNSFAFLSRRSSLSYQIRRTMKLRGIIPFAILNDCVLSYYTVIVSRENSQLLISMNTVIMRLRDSGVINYWGSTEMKSEKEMKSELNNRVNCSESCIRTKFKCIFIFYFVCVAPSILIFFTELMFAGHSTNTGIHFSK